MHDPIQMLLTLQRADGVRACRGLSTTHMLDTIPYEGSMALRYDVVVQVHSSANRIHSNFEMFKQKHDEFIENFPDDGIRLVA